MDVVLAWILGIAMGAILFTVLVTVGTVWALRRWNRVDPRTPGLAPLRWLCSPSRCARLHRRLRMAVVNARMRPRDDRPVRARSRRKAPQDTLVAGLVAYACALDRQLVTASRAPFVFRIEQLAHLGAEISQVEHLAARLSGAQLGPLPSPPPPPLRHIAERLDAVDAARRELDALEPTTQMR
ncbi:MAG: hypothetical protein ACRDZO_12665 [Egibacteraceae bacterium]